MLYDHFKQVFEEKKKSLPDLEERVSKLKSMNANIAKTCIKGKADNDLLGKDFKMALPIVMGYVIDVTKPWCALFARSEMAFAKQIREHQSAKVATMRLKGQIMR